MSGYFERLTEGFGQAWNRFWFTPSDPYTLSVLRVLVGLVAIYNIATYSFDLDRFFGPADMLPTDLINSLLESRSTADVTYRFSFFDNIHNSGELWAFHLLSLFVLVLFTIGFYSRVTSVLALLVVLSYAHRAIFLTSEFEGVLAFVMLYICLGSSGACLSVDSWRAAKKPAGPTAPASYSATISLRLIQVHLTVVYVMMLLGQLSAPVWWNGQAAWWLALNTQDALIDLVIVKELTEIRDKYGDARRTTILDETAELGLEDLIADEQVAVTVTNTGYLKRTPISVYRQQRRGGTGRLGMKTREEDFVAQLIIDSTHAYLLCFTNTGRVYWVKIYEVPDVGAAGKGKAMASLIDLQPGEKVVTILGVRDLEEESKYVLFATREGTVKKTALKDFSNVMSRGIIAINIEKNDELVCARITDGQQIIFLATHDGMAIRFSEADLRAMGRPATGNRGINLRKGDYVIGAAVTPSNDARNKERLARAAAAGLSSHVKDAIDEAADSASAHPLELATGDDTPAAPVISEAAQAKLDKLDKQLGLTPCLILTVSENGFGKRTDVDAYRLQSRGGKGVISMKTTPKIGKVSAINLVDDTTEMMLISQFGKIIRIDTKTIRSAGRSTSGVKLLNLDDADKVAAAVVIPPEDAKIQPENGTLLQ